MPVPDPAVRAMFDPLPGRTYLDAATYGLPPRPAVQAMERALRAWQTGSARWVDDWDRPAEAARAEFATIIGASASDIALLPSASVAMGLVAEALKAGDVVVVPEDEHVSDLFPLLVAERRGVEVRQVPFADVVGAIDERTTLVAASLVQMQTGRIGDLDGICRRARAVGAGCSSTRPTRFRSCRSRRTSPTSTSSSATPTSTCSARAGRRSSTCAPTGSTIDAELCQLARRTRSVDALLRRTADARRRRVAVQLVTRLAPVGRDGRVHPIDRFVVPRRDARRATRAGRSTRDIARPGADRLVARVRAHRRSEPVRAALEGWDPRRRPRRCDPLLAPRLERRGRCRPGGRGDPALCENSARAVEVPSPDGARTHPVLSFWY